MTKNQLVVVLTLLVGSAISIAVLWGGARTALTEWLPLESRPDVWCEGLPVERCGEFPQHCREAAYCDGTRFCSTWNGEDACAGDGDISGPAACCPGLLPRCGVVSKDATCDSQLGTPARPVCRRCGDGVCDARETRCDCPEDCDLSRRAGGLPSGDTLPSGRR